METKFKTRKKLRQVTGTTVGFTFTKEERECKDLNEVGALYDLEIKKVEDPEKEL
jgi:hypothetical protein